MIKEIYESEYLAPSSEWQMWEDGIHHIRLSVDREDPHGVSNRITLNPNACTLDVFGDMDGCSKMAVYSRRFNLQYIDSSEQWTLYNIEIMTDDYTGPPMNVVFSKNNGRIKLLVGRDKVRVVPLFALPWSTRPPIRRSGDLSFKKIGHELMGYLKTLGGSVAAPSFLSIEEYAAKGTDACNRCGERVNMGNFTLMERELDLTLDLPFIAVHALADHGDAEFHVSDAKGGETPVELLMAILHLEEGYLGTVLEDLLSPINAINSPLAIEHKPLRGTENCSACGESMNMGGFELINTLNDKYIELPYMAVHWLEAHRQAKYSGSENNGRLNLELLRKILGVAPDNKELGVQLQKYLPQFGEPLELPEFLAIEDHLMKGLEDCSQCSKRPNMGFFILENTALNEQIKIPYIAIHALEHHDSAYYHGSLHQGWIDVTLLRRMLREPVRGDG